MRNTLSRPWLAGMPNGAGKSTATPLRLEVTISWLSAPSRVSCNWYGISPETGSGWLTFNQSVSRLTVTWPLATKRVLMLPGLPSAKICAVIGRSNAWAVMFWPLRPLVLSKRKSPLS